jgi:hypothetical protein
MHELQILVNKLRDLSIKIPESFQVGAIIAMVTDMRIGMIT